MSALPPKAEGIADMKADMDQSANALVHCSGTAIASVLGSAIAAVVVNDHVSCRHIEKNELSRRHSLLLMGAVAFAWGTTWPVTKAIVEHLSPLWTTCIR